MNDSWSATVKGLWSMWRLGLLDNHMFWAACGAAVYSIIYPTSWMLAFRHLFVGIVMAGVFGSVPLQFINWLLGTELKAEGFDRISGFIVGAFGIMAFQIAVEFIRIRTDMVKKKGQFEPVLTNEDPQYPDFKDPQIPEDPNGTN